MNKKLILFPSTRNMCAVARYSSMLDGYTLQAITHVDSMMLNQKDISEVDGGDHTNISIQGYNTELLSSCDALFMDYDNRDDFSELVTEIINHASGMSIDILINKKHDKIERKNGTEEKIYNDLDYQKIHDITVPVIYILSQSDFTDQFIVELALRKHFISKGYKVGQIGSHDASCLFGFTAMPDFIFENRDAAEKIIMFNKYIYDKVKNEDMDLLIIGVPGAIMRHNNNILQGLGVIPFVVTNSVRSDASVFCMHACENIKKYLEEIKRFCHYRFDCSPEYYCISNTNAGYDMKTSEKKLTYTSLDSEFVLSNLRNEVGLEDIHVFNSLDKKSIMSFCEKIEEDLSQNVIYMK